MFYVLLFVALLFKLSPKYHAEVQSGVPKLRKVVRCLTEKTQVLHELPLSLSNSTKGHEFNINESTIYIK